MKTASIKLPALKTKKVWISCYFNHYNAIVFFSKKPYLTKVDSGDNWRNSDTPYYDLIHNKNRDIIAGVMSLGEVKYFYPSLNLSPLLMSNGNVISMEPEILIEVMLTSYWDGNKLMNLDYSLDGYQRS